MKLPDIKVYWLTWCGVIVALLVLKVLAKSFGWSVSSWLGHGYIAGIWVPLMFLNYFEQQPLRARIEEIRREHVGAFAASIWWTQLRVVFGGDTLGDAEVARLRQRQLGFMKLVLLSLLLFPVLMALLSH